MTTIRNYIPGEWLPWEEKEIGFSPRDFDPDWVWIVFVDGRMTAMLVTAKMFNTILITRLLSTGSAGCWLRTLWLHVRDVCWKRRIVGFWTTMDNEREPERKLLKLLSRESKAATRIEVTAATGSWVKGRF